MSIHNLKLVHYTSNLLLLQDLQIRKQKESLNMKPRGLWVSVENKGSYGWKQWCLSEEFRVEELIMPHLVTLASNANILHISSIEELDEFNNEYKQYLIPNLGMAHPKWNQVAEKYQGIIISPYLWERRFDSEMLWYYAWDCASGCIWDNTAIKSINFMIMRNSIQ